MYVKLHMYMYYIIPIYAVFKVMDETNLPIEYHENWSQDHVTSLSEQLTDITINQEDDVEAVVPTEQSSLPAENSAAGNCKL